MSGLGLILLQRVGCEAIEHAGGQCVALSLAGGLFMVQSGVMPDEPAAEALGLCAAYLRICWISA